MKFCEDKYELDRKTQLIFINIIYLYTPLSQTYEHAKKKGMKFLKTGIFKFVPFIQVRS